MSGSPVAVAGEPTTPVLDVPVHDPASAASSGIGRRRKAGRLPVEALVASMRADLAGGRFSPRERLVEADLVERYAAPRAAVREALIQLATEGLVERAPNRGARVRGMTLVEAIEIAEVRRELESLAAARAAQRATTAERSDILTLSEAFRAAASDGDVDEYLRLNARFHQRIKAMARQGTLDTILAQFEPRPIDRFIPEPFRPRPPDHSVEAHIRIARAVAIGDAPGAHLAMYEHLTNLVDDLRLYERIAPRKAPAATRWSEERGGPATK